MNNVLNNRDFITSFIGMMFLLMTFFISLSFSQVAWGQSLDRVISDEMDRELGLYEDSFEKRSRVVPIYQGNEEIVNDTPLELAIDGQCGTQPNTCIEGKAINIRRDRGYRWSCRGRHGGSTSPCYIKESVVERKQRRQIELTEKIDQEISDHIESERLRVLEEHGQKTVGLLEGKNTKDKPNQRVSSVQHKAPVNTVRQAPVKKAHDEVKAYISGGAGVTLFSEVDNISNGFNAGVSVGAKFPRNFLFEVGFVYSDFKLDNYGFYYYPRATARNSAQCIDCHIREYAGILNVKYHLFNKALRPFAGFSGVYRYRTYQENSYYNSYRYNSSSHGFDVGPNVGIDFALSSQFIVGAEVKYMINLTNSVSDSHLIYMYRRPDEQLSDDLSYFTFGISAKFLL